MYHQSSYLRSCPTLSSNKSFGSTTEPVDSGSVPKVNILTTLTKFMELQIEAILPWKIKA
jgi:hypothetical protein